MSTVSITKEEYVKLLKRDEELSFLEAGGVDNWEWYEDSLEGIEASFEKIEKDVYAMKGGE
jgi:hypothetical protein